MSDTVRLHWFNSTNPEKVRLALEELGIPYERVHVNLSKGEHKTDAYRELHPRSKVPALEIDGNVLWESGAILNYLGQREARLWPTEGTTLAKALNLIFLESAAFQAPAGVFFINRKILPSIGKSPDPKRMEAAQKKIDPVLRVLSEQLAESDYLLGDFSLVDLAYAPSLPWLDLDGFPALVRWRKRLMKRESWTRCEVSGPV
jgi:GST-like protein